MEPVSAPIRELLDVFSTSLPDVKFGEIDAASLEAKAAEVRAAAAHLAAVQTSLDVARAAFDAQQEALGQMAQRAMAYARVYAETNGALTATLEAIALPRAVRKPTRQVANAGASAGDAAESTVGASPDSPDPVARRRGRVRKEADASQAELAVGSAE